MGQMPAGWVIHSSLYGWDCPKNGSCEQVRHPLERLISSWRLVASLLTVRLLIEVNTVSDTKSRAQPACHREQKKGRFECTYECDVEYEDVNVRINVMYNMDVCRCRVLYWNVHCTLVRNIRREKTLGEIWAAVIKTINNLLWTSVASNAGSPEWGQSHSQYMARREPWRTYSRDASRRPKPKYVHC
jgi:hypothetical protein